MDVKPEAVARIEFLEWTGANHLRHTKFVALRNDKDPLMVVRRPDRVPLYQLRIIAAVTREAVDICLYAAYPLDHTFPVYRYVEKRNTKIMPERRPGKDQDRTGKSIRQGLPDFKLSR